MVNDYRIGPYGVCSSSYDFVLVEGWWQRMHEEVVSLKEQQYKENKIKAKKRFILKQH